MSYLDHTQKAALHVSDVLWAIDGCNDAIDGPSHRRRILQEFGCEHHRSQKELVRRVELCIYNCDISLCFTQSSGTRTHTRPLPITYACLIFYYTYLLETRSGDGFAAARGRSERRQAM